MKTICTTAQEPKEIHNPTGKSKLKKNALFNSLSFVFISGVNFLTLPFIVGKMNFEVFGIYTLLTGLFGYFGICDFGLGQGLIKFVSEYHTTNQLKKISVAINSCLLFQLTIGAILIVILYFSSEGVVGLFNVSAQHFLPSVWAFKIALVGLFISLVSAIFSSVLMGLQRYDLTSSVDSVLNFLLNISLVVLLLYKKVNLGQAVLLSVLFSLATLLTYIVLIRKFVPYYKLQLEFDLSIVKRFIKYSINIFLSKISSLFSTYLVRFILAYFLTPTAVTLFVVPSKLLGALGGMLSSGANAIFPYISSLQAQKDGEEIKKSFLQGTAIFTGIALPAFLFLTLYSKQVLSVWMGPNFAEKTWLVLSIISLSSLAGSMSAIPNLVTMGMGNSRLIAFFSLVSIVLYAIFLPFLTAKFGLTGACIALLIASSGTIVFVLYYNLKFIQVRVFSYLQVTFAIHVLPGLLFIGLSLLVLIILSFKSLYSLAIGLFLLLCYYYFIYIKLYLTKSINKRNESNYIGWRVGYKA